MSSRVSRAGARVVRVVRVMRQDWVSVAVTLIAGIGIIGAAAFTAAATARRERAARRADREARALTDFADAAVNLREAFRGAAGQAADRDRAWAVFLYRRLAVHSVRVRDLAATWEQSVRDATSFPDRAGDEEAVWVTLLTALGAALRDAF
jgi:hypothetical protein